MAFLGWQLGEIALLFGGAGAFVVALYLLRRTRKRVPVAALYLWTRALPSRRTASLFGKLTSLLSLIVALIVLALLALSLGEPSTDVAREGRDTICILDATASMAATDEPPTRFSRALDLVEQDLASFGAHDRALVAYAANAVVPVRPWSQHRATLEDAIRELRAAPPIAGAAAGVDHDAIARFVLDATRQHSGARFVFVSDSAFAPSPAYGAELSAAGLLPVVLGVGTSGDNVGITHFAARRYPLDPSRVELLVTVLNASASSRRVRVELFDDEAPLDVYELDVPPGSSTSKTFANLSGVDRTLTARIVHPAQESASLPDHLPTDDEATTRLPPRRRPKVLVVSGGNRYLEAALLLDEFMAVTSALPGEEVDTSGFDVVIYDRVLPETPPAAHALYLGPDDRRGGVSPLPVRGERPRPFFDRVDRTHPVVRGVALADTNIRTALQVTRGTADHVVGGDEGTPLLVAGERDGKRFVALLFDVTESDLPLRTAWPLLVLNSIEWLTRPASVGDEHSPDPMLPGAESRIAPTAARTNDEPNVTAPSASWVDTFALWQILLALALGLLVVEWALYERRRTV